jgi:hypothetical protein
LFTLPREYTNFQSKLSDFLFIVPFHSAFHALQIAYAVALEVDLPYGDINQRMIELLKCARRIAFDESRDSVLPFKYQPAVSCNETRNFGLRMQI